MKLEKIASNPNFEVREVGIPNYKYGTPVAISTSGEKIVRHDVFHKASGMCVAGNLHLIQNGGGDEISFNKKGCLIRTLQDNVFSSNNRFMENTFIENDGTILFILQDLENITSLSAKNNGNFTVKFTDKGVKIKRKLVSGDTLYAELSYDELRLGNKHIIFDNESFSQIATQSVFGE